MIVFLRSIRVAVSLLMMCCIGAFGQTSPAAGKRTRPDTPDMVEMRNYRLSMEKLNKFAAAAQSLTALSKSNPGMKSAMQGGLGAKTMDEGVKVMESKYPEAATAIQKSGMSVREFFLVSVTLMTTSMVVGMKKQGQAIDQLPATVSAENLAFVEQNSSKIEKLLNGLSSSSE